MIDGTGFVDSEKRVLCTTEVKRIRIACSNAILFLGPFVVLRKKKIKLCHQIVLATYAAICYYV